ncbi:MAG: hypothetical protein PHC66_03570 [Candidatus Nanoarchaeia archaeon]|nr:hypothetical protein [Candidatus Nanoarchaeia archaeon]MDD5239815.1 hypothetical protein [Candidatus Nanoarchaeia archaeon]
MSYTENSEFEIKIPKYENFAGIRDRLNQYLNSINWFEGLDGGDNANYHVIAILQKTDERCGEWNALECTLLERECFESKGFDFWKVLDKKSYDKSIQLLSSLPKEADVNSIIAIREKNRNSNPDIRFYIKGDKILYYPSLSTLTTREEANQNITKIIAEELGLIVKKA